MNNNKLSTEVEALINEAITDTISDHQMVCTEGRIINALLGIKEIRQAFTLATESNNAAAIIRKIRKGIKEMNDEIPRFSEETLELYRSQKTPIPIRKSMSLSTVIEKAVDISKVVLITGQIEVFHMFLACVMSDFKSPLDEIPEAMLTNILSNLCQIYREKFPDAEIDMKYISQMSENKNEFQDEEGFNLGEKDEDSVFYYDMIEKAKKDTKPFIGREEEMQLLMQCLARRDKPNAILTGEPGVGKSDIVRGLAKLIAGKKVPKQLSNSTLYLVDVPAMLAGAQFRGQFEERLKSTLDEISKDSDPIIFIDEIHTIVGAGTGSDSSMDAANILKPYLTDGKLRVIGATTVNEYRKFIERDQALMRRFLRVNVNEPSIEDAIKIIEGIKCSYEEFHKLEIPDVVIKRAVEASHRHMHDRYLPDKAIDIIDGTCARIKLTTRCKKITENDVEETISKLCHIPKKTIQSNEIDKLRELDTKIKATVFGQDTAIDKLTEAIQMSRLGLNDETKPIGSFLFVGPSGVGKTEVAKQLANSLSVPFIRFDMSEYSEEHSVAKLIGSPAGYVGYDDGGLLVEQVRQNPNSVVLFDEIEKAHPAVYKIFLQIFDYGMLSDSKGRQADFRNAVIIMTSNAGSTKHNVSKNIGFGKDVSNKPNSTTALNAINELMPPELRGRISSIVCFNPMNDDMAKLVALKELNKLSAKMLLKDITVKFDRTVVEEVAKRGASEEFGAREIQKVIDKDIKILFVKKLLEENTTKNYEMSYDGNDFVILEKKQSNKKKQKELA